MSYNVAICLAPIPASDDGAWASLDAVIDAEGRASAELVELHDALTARFPCLCDLPDDQIDEGVWGDGPLINNFGHRAAVLGIVPSRVDEVLPFLVATATRAGMTVFDWATDTIHRPPVAGG